MNKFDEAYNTILKALEPLGEAMPADLAAAGYERMPQNTNLPQLPPEQQAEVSKAIADILNKLPKSATPGYSPAGGPITNIPAVASAIEKIKIAGTKALDVVGNLTVKEILGVAKNILTAPVQVQQAALKNLTQAGIKTGQDVANILTNIAKQKGATEQEIAQILKSLPTKVTTPQPTNLTKGPISADRAAAGYEN